MQAGIDLENRTQVLSSFAGDLEEAMAAFLEKRPPRFTTDRCRRSDMTGDWTGGRALVTGGGRGIGRAIALGLAADGADVAINYRTRRGRRRSRPSPTSRRSAGGRAAYAASVDDPDAVRGAWPATVLDDFGPVDILVHNAGHRVARAQTSPTPTPAEIERVFRTHALGAFVLCKTSCPPMRERDARRRRDDLAVRRPSHMARELVAVQHGQGRARGARDDASPRRSGATAST